MKELTDATYEAACKTGIVLVDFWAPWCGPCKLMGKVLEEVEPEFPTIKFYKLNIDANEKIPQHYKIMSIPTLQIYKNGILVVRISGTMTKEKLTIQLKMLTE